MSKRDRNERTCVAVAIVFIMTLIVFAVLSMVYVMQCKEGCAVNFLEFLREYLTVGKVLTIAALYGLGVFTAYTY